MFRFFALLVKHSEDPLIKGYHELMHMSTLLIESWNVHNVLD